MTVTLLLICRACDGSPLAALRISSELKDNRMSFDGAKIPMNTEQVEVWADHEEEINFMFNLEPDQIQSMKDQIDLARLPRI